MSSRDRGNSIHKQEQNVFDENTLRNPSLIRRRQARLSNRSCPACSLDTVYLQIVLQSETGVEWGNAHPSFANPEAIQISPATSISSGTTDGAPIRPVLMDLLHLHPSNNREHLSKNGQLAASLKNNGTSSKKERVGGGRVSIH